jgi:predicted 3-demethylubiquinone-9 3-methyltransferase (glyoxalase superfamily)
MPLRKYDWSEYYGWVQDKYGVSWQLMLSDPEGDPRPFIVPSLQFAGPVQNRAAEAIDYYASVFQNSKKASAWPYGEPTGPATAESLMYADFQLDGQWFAANDSGVEQDFTFSPGISLLVNCKDQAEIDTLWSELSVVPEAEQCGWCQDKYGVSWQIAPENMEELMKKPGAYKTMMQQHKIVIAEY